MIIHNFPLNIYILYDSASDEAQKIYEYIYKLLCRDSDKPLESGICIPVYRCTNSGENKIADIDYDKADLNIVIALVDLFMYSSQEWENFVQKVLEKSQTPHSNVKFLSVALTNYATDFAGLGRINIIKYGDNNIFNHKSDFEIRLYDFVISVLKRKTNEPLQIFISHAKKDGKEKADELKSYIAMNTKLQYFYDANSIKDGTDFFYVINKNAENSLLVVLNSDSYSERDWCQREIIVAKDADCPIVLVDLINGTVARSFPYLGNIPWIAYKDGDWENVLKLLLRTVVVYTYQKVFLKYLAHKRNYTDCKILPCAPEVFSVSRIAEDNVLYPEPPLGFAEKKLLQNRYPCKRFYTSSVYSESDDPILKDKRIAVSVSDSEDSNKNGISNLLLHDLIMELARYIIINDGTLVYGGDLRKEGFTQSFKDIARNYKEQTRTESSKTFFTNYFAWPIYLEIKDNKEILADFKYSRVKTVFVDPPKMDGLDKGKYLKPNTFEHKTIWAKSLKKMRQEKERNTDVIIIAGGKKSGFKGFMSGILEEFITAINMGHPIYLLGGYGGMAELITEVLDKNLKLLDFKGKLFEDKNYKEFFDHYNEESLDKINLDNVYSTIKENKCLVNKGLSDEEQRTLMYSNNIIESVELVFKGLKEIL